jgi:hypothetical protein
VDGSKQSSKLALPRRQRFPLWHRELEDALAEPQQLLVGPAGQPVFFARHKLLAVQRASELPRLQGFSGNPDLHGEHQRTPLGVGFPVRIWGGE